MPPPFTSYTKLLAW